METNEKETMAANENHELKSEQVNEQEINSNEQLNEEKIKELETKLQEATDKHVRLLAEFDNYKKRVTKEREEIKSNVSRSIYKNVLPVVDDFERAIVANEKVEDISILKDGFHLIYKRMKSVLAQGEVIEFENLMGAEFNSDTMEAITSIPVTEENQKGKVVDVIEKGYAVNGLVVRFAKVVIGA